ncbi:MAG: xanthine dehydrogenase family protein molybdopterin-binding subunit [Armatimonadota bacterium]|nr:xanthine dehydrogenase family protein molybdopterin-binding subunit [Armatimonadota bacterium]
MSPVRGVDVTFIGASVPDHESRRLVAGCGRYVEDLKRPGMLHLAAVRSPWPHARIVAVDLAGVRAMPGVAAVVTARDIPATATTMAPSTRFGDLHDVTHPTLAGDVVRYEGEPVAVIAAESLIAAWDAVAAARVEYEPLPAVADLDAALAPDAPLVHPHRGTNVLFTYDLRGGPDDEPTAARILTAEMALPRVAAVPLEGRAVLAEPTPDGRLQIWLSTQVPHRACDRFAAMLGLDRWRVRVRTPDVGGAFGAKGNNPWPEEFVAAWLASHLRRPVRWVETRRDGLLALPQGRGQRARLRVQVDADARLLALEAEIDADIGAYCLANTPGPPLRTANVITGPYRVPRVRVRIRGIASHRVPTGPYRGAGRPEATYYLERLMDLIAEDVGLDGAEVRRRNFVRPSEMPYDTRTGAVIDSGDYAAAMDRVLAVAGAPRIGAPASTPGTLTGVGLATFAELTGGSFPEYARVEIGPDGQAVVACGISPHGQGTATALAQIAATHLGLPLDRIHVITGDTDVVPEGIGTFGSRSLALGGAATDEAARALRTRIVERAAQVLEAAPEDIALRDGRAFVRGSAERGVSLEVLIGGTTWTETARVDPQVPAVSVGAHLAVVEVSTETGEVRLARYAAVDDPGVIVNPALVEGQLYGGIMQGIGTALCEAVAHDSSGHALTATLLDYAVPRIRHLPDIRLTTQETPTPTTVLGAKGVGEAGTIGALAAISNAVVAALRPLGVRHLDPPYTPQRVMRVLQTVAASEVPPERR